MTRGKEKANSFKQQHAVVKVGKIQRLKGKQLDPQADGQRGLSIQDQLRDGMNLSLNTV